jgi:hypothetical protein
MTSSNNDRIHQLLDGELDSANEAVLFNDLAQNSELRSEFMQLLAIRTAVQQDRAALVPPIALTNSVFAGLGIAGPLAGAAAGAAGGAVASTWLSKILIPTIAALTAAGITYGITASSEGARYIVPKTSSEGARYIEPPSAPSNQAELRHLRSEIARLHAELAEAKQQPEEVVSVQNSSLQEAYDEPETMATPIDLTHTITLAREQDARVIMPMNQTPIVPEYRDYPSFYVQVRGLSSSGLTPVSVAPQSTLAENVNLALLYQLSPKHQIGVEVGNETFPMSFNGNRNGQLIRYEQQPVSTWAGITYRYSFAPIGSSALTPFAQGLIGGTQFGPLGRLAGGLQYSPAGPLTFMLGVEGTTMAYTYQNQWFTSSKLGLTYGMAIRF